MKYVLFYIFLVTTANYLIQAFVRWDFLWITKIPDWLASDRFILLGSLIMGVIVCWISKQFRDIENR